MSNLSIERKEDYAILKLHHGKFNLLNSVFLLEIIQALQELSQNDDIRGLIVVGQPGFFSLGLHVKEVAELSGEALIEIGKHISLVNYEMVTFPKPVVAAINGHAPAGGTLLASGADYRVMADDPKYVFGLNELGANISLPYDIAQGLIFWLGEGKAYPYLMEGKLIKPEEAFDIGMVNELVPLEEVLEKAEVQLKKYLKTSTIIFTRVKRLLRQKWVGILEDEKKRAHDEWGVFWQKEEIRENFRKFAARL